MVSIHAPREGCDNNLIMRRTHSVSFNSRTPGGVRLHLAYEDNDLTYVSIHAPREGCDGRDAYKGDFSSKFQFTHPGRGATLRHPLFTPSLASFNSRTPGGVRPTEVLVKYLPRSVSIHAPREGCDWGVRRSPVQRDVSIHAPREGCDLFTLRFIRLEACFNSRTPGGVRRNRISSGISCTTFQFTHPGRGATVRTA